MPKKLTQKTKEKGVEEHIEELAAMVARGFSGMDKKMDERFSDMDQRFDAIDKRLDKIENVLLMSHQNQIDQLRDTVLRVVAFVNMPKEKRAEK